MYTWLCWQSLLASDTRLGFGFCHWCQTWGFHMHNADHGCIVLVFYVKFGVSICLIRIMVVLFWKQPLHSHGSWLYWFENQPNFNISSPLPELLHSPLSKLFTWTFTVAESLHLSIHHCWSFYIHHCPSSSLAKLCQMKNTICWEKFQYIKQRPF